LADRDGEPTCPPRAPEVTPWGEAEVLLRQGTSSALTRQLTSTATDERTCFSWDVIPPRPLPRSSRWPPPPLLSVPPLWPSPRQPPQLPTLTGTVSPTASPVETGPLTLATATTVVCSSPRAPGAPTVAASSHRLPTRPPANSRS